MCSKHGGHRHSVKHPPSRWWYVTCSIHYGVLGIMGSPSIVSESFPLWWSAQRRSFWLLTTTIICTATVIKNDSSLSRRSFCSDSWYRCNNMPTSWCTVHPSRILCMWWAVDCDSYHILYVCKHIAYMHTYIINNHTYIQLYKGFWMVWLPNDMICVMSGLYAGVHNNTWVATHLHMLGLNIQLPRTIQSSFIDHEDDISLSS